MQLKRLVSRPGLGPGPGQAQGCCRHRSRLSPSVDRSGGDLETPPPTGRAMAQCAQEPECSAPGTTPQPESEQVLLLEIREKQNKGCDLVKEARPRGQKQDDTVSQPAKGIPR